jgi:hypothetical protein
MAIFALGGSAIVALFITNVRLSRQAMDYTRAAEISRNVRSLVTQSLSRPIPVAQAGAPPIYKFDYPGTSLTFRPSQYMQDVERGGGDAPKDVGGKPTANTLFFRLPVERFDARVTGEDNLRRVQTLLPNDAVDEKGALRAWGTQGGRPDVFRMVPDLLRQAGAIDGLDKDDRMFYSFDFSVRRSVARSQVEDPKNPGVKLPLEDLYVVQVRIYKSFTFREDAGMDVENTPIYEWDFFVSAAR